MLFTVVVISTVVCLALAIAVVALAVGYEMFCGEPERDSAGPAASSLSSPGSVSAKELGGKLDSDTRAPVQAA